MYDDGKSGDVYWLINSPDDTIGDHHWAVQATPEERLKWVKEKAQQLDEKFRVLIEKTEPSGMKSVTVRDSPRFAARVRK